jgi:Xaa-Pro aminopeptidase
MLEQKLPELIANRSVLWHSLGHDADWDRRIASALNAVRAESRSGIRAPAKSAICAACSTRCD